MTGDTRTRHGRSGRRRKLAAVVLTAAALFIGATNLAMPSEPANRISDHFDGRVFFNPAIRARERGVGDLLKWWSARRPPVWHFRDLTPGPPPPARVGGDRCRATFVNHATMLVQIDGLNILTDPIWSERAGPLSWAGPRRMHPPGLRFEDLPSIDVVLISHNHYDHMDLATLRRLAAAHHPRFFTGLGNKPYLESRGVTGVTELDWWDEAPLGAGQSVVFTPAQHFSSRAGFDHHRTLWGGFFVKTRTGAIFFGGDTGYAAHFRQVRERLGAPRLALLPIGAYEPRWFMQQMHMNPADAVRAARDLDAPVSIGVHFGAFALADDAQDQPPRDLQTAREAAGWPADRFFVLRPGEGRDLPAAAATATARAAGD